MNITDSLGLFSVYWRPAGGRVKAAKATKRWVASTYPRLVSTSLLPPTHCAKSMRALPPAMSFQSTLRIHPIYKAWPAHPTSDDLQVTASLRRFEWKWKN